MHTDDSGRTEALEQSLIEVAVETWRLSRLFARVLSKLDAGDQTRYVSRLRYFEKKIDGQLQACGLKLVSVEGEPFDPGIAASAVNLADFAPEDTLLVEQMVEPIVMGVHGLKRPGTVLLRKVHI
jgi:hypothetical protein